MGWHNPGRDALDRARPRFTPGALAISRFVRTGLVDAASGRAGCCVHATPRAPAGNNASMLRTSELDYHLPDDLIATRPAEPRDSARLLVIDRDDPSRRQPVTVRDVASFFREGDLLVVNDSRVLPARLTGTRRSSGGRVSGLFLGERPAQGDAPGVWRVMLKSNGRLRPGDVIDLTDAHEKRTSVSLTLIDKTDDSWLVRAQDDETTGRESAQSLLTRVGATPLPPYILSARKQRHESIDDDRDRAWYQTVYADASHAGSVAAPTAGLHLTPALLSELASRGVRTARVTLHVGAGTFKPVEVDVVEEHPMHAEWAEVPASTLRAVAETRARHPGSRVICVGTTSARALETPPADAPTDQPWIGETRILITPGYPWKRVDGMLTNFHLPRSTLLAMIAALLPRGVADLLPIYEQAVRDRFRFYSYGDAMLILPDALPSPDGR
jgi:S-adenosylmethionine:tRNA ribosyltransferase-isomerase